MRVLLVGEALGVAEDLCALCGEQVNDDDGRLQIREESVPCGWGRKRLPDNQKVREAGACRPETQRHHNESQ